VKGRTQRSDRVVREVAHAWKRNPLSDLDKILHGRNPRRNHQNFGEDRLRCLWLAGGQILPFPIGFRSRPYNTPALLLCYAMLCYGNDVLSVMCVCL